MIDQMFIIVITLVLFNVETTLSASRYPKLLVVSYDAFRYDYFNGNSTVYMNRLKGEGTYVDYMKNIFVTKTFPNHHTIATGLYAENHGVVDNEIYNAKTNTSVKYSYELYHFNNGVLPIWTLNEIAGNGRHSGSMMWPGSIYEYQGVKPTFAEAYNITIPWKNRIDTLVSWFAHPSTPINFGALYIEEPDVHGHALGTNDPRFKDILRKLDNITNYLHQRLNKFNLTDVNVIHLSDHGMANVVMDRIINLTKYIDDDDYRIVGTSPGLHIYPKPGKEELVYRNLITAARETKHFKVYKREDIPAMYHYGNNTRIGPIFIIADVGYAFQNLYNNIKYYEKAFNFTANNKSEFGLHGYDNRAEEMQPIFFAKGPAFKERCKLQPFNNVDLLPLFCKILEIKCPLLNGTLDGIQNCLVHRTDTTDVPVFIIIYIISAIMLFGITGALLIYLIRRKPWKPKVNYKKIPIYSDGEWAVDKEFYSV